MKDSEARKVINLLTKRIKQLDRELQLFKNPHPKNCKCKDCKGLVPDYTSITTYFDWWDDKTEVS